MEIIERLTWKEIEERFPMQWVGLIEVVYKNDDGITIESAIVKYSDKSKSELTMMAINGEDIDPRFTTPNETWQMGVVGRSMTL